MYHRREKIVIKYKLNNITLSQNVIKNDELNRVEEEDDGEGEGEEGSGGGADEEEEEKKNEKNTATTGNKKKIYNNNKRRSEGRNNNKRNSEGNSNKRCSDSNSNNTESNLTVPIIRPRGSVSQVKYPDESFCEYITRIMNKDPYPYKYDYEMDIDNEQNMLNIIYKQISIVFLFYQPAVIKRENPFIESIKRDGETFTVTSPETILNRNREKQLANQPSRNRSLVTSLSTSDMDTFSSSLNHKMNGIHMVKHNDSLFNASNQSFNHSRLASNSLDGIRIDVKPSSSSSLHTHSHLLTPDASAATTHSINAKTTIPEISSSVHN